jgi:DNA-binding Lrp family transcriptional regulator
VTTQDVNDGDNIELLGSTTADEYAELAGCSPDEAAERLEQLVARGLAEREVFYVAVRR